MEIRGDRKCQECGTRWSYYETGSVACPNCGSLRSVGVDDRRRHTDAPATLDLSPQLNRLDEADVRDIADDVQSVCREYARKRGFVNAGDLLPPDDRFLLAYELVNALDLYGRLRDANDDEEAYVMALLRAVSAPESVDRPAAAVVPASMREARGLGYAEALLKYRRELVAWLDDHPDPEAKKTLGTLHEELKRVRALQGDVPPEIADRLVGIARGIDRYLREDDETALANARERLRALSEATFE